MILDDVRVPTHHEKVWPIRKRVTLGLGVDWASWALPLWVSVGTTEVRMPEGDWKERWGAILQVGPLYVGVTW